MKQIRDISAYGFKDLINLNNELKKEGGGDRLNVGILRSFSLEGMIPLIEASLRAKGIEPVIELGGYNQIQQEILNDDSFIYDDSCDLIHIALTLKEVSVALNDEISEMHVTERKDEVGNVVSLLGGMLDNIRQRTNKGIILDTFSIPSNGDFGLYDIQSQYGQKEAIFSVNQGVKQYIHDNQYKQVYLHDIDGLVKCVGEREAYDKRLEYLYKCPYSIEGQVEYSKRLGRLILAIKRTRKKCIVLDCDNTLWGGVIGEEGLDGIKLGEEYPGICFKEFQKRLLSLTYKGFILAINSKNNEKDVEEVLASHPHQILRKEHFSSIKVNWNDKATNIGEIARDLNIGTDSLVFIDDSSFECERVKSEFSEVIVRQMPENPMEISSILERIEELDFVEQTEEDRYRREMYEQNSSRNELRSSSNSIEEFYRSLNMKMTVHVNRTEQIERISQLCQKTNQFNLTTRRHSVAEIDQFMKDGKVFSFSLEDKFGNNGLVGVAIVTGDRDQYEIDTFLMSCRVIQRTAEDQFLTAILNVLAEEGSKNMLASRIRSDKNKITSFFYEKNGFALMNDDDEKKLYVLEMSDRSIPAYNSWIEVSIE